MNVKLLTCLFIITLSIGLSQGDAVKDVIGDDKGWFVRPTSTCDTVTSTVTQMATVTIETTLVSTQTETHVYWPASCFSSPGWSSTPAGWSSTSAGWSSTSAGWAEPQGWSSATPAGWSEPQGWSATPAGWSEPQGWSATPAGWSEPQGWSSAPPGWGPPPGWSKEENGENIVENVFPTPALPSPAKTMAATPTINCAVDECP